jgi:hypothetical protein
MALKSGALSPTASGFCPEACREIITKRASKTVIDFIACGLSCQFKFMKQFLLANNLNGLRLNII